MDSTNGSSPQRGSGSDETFDRLRAADPAAGLEPDLHAIRATVTAKVSSSAADGSTTSAATSEQGSDAGVVDLATARSRRRPARWLQVAAAAVGVAAVGTAGYAVGTQDGGSGISADSASTADMATDESAPESGAQAPFSLPSTDESAASSADRSMIAGFGMRTLFTAVGLDDTPSAASAWGYDPSATFTPESALAVAQAVGLEGEPSLLYGAWHVGSTDWTGPALDVQSDSATSFSYYDPSIDPWAEGSGATAVDGAEATARLSEIMTSLGVDPAGFDLVVEDMGTATATTVSAYRTAGSVNDGQVWQLTVSSLGVSSLNGALAPLVDLGSYDVVGAATAVARLTDPRFGATADYGIMPFARAADDVQVAEGATDGVTPEEAQALEEANPSLDVMPEPGVEAPSDDPAAVPTLPPSAVPGSVISWPVSEVAITGAELTTTTVYSADGSVVLVPAYRLAGDDGSSWTVIAVTEEHLDFAAR